ncbi:GDP-mannose 4,6-dehydratase [Patescibacteria group bacterium]|nr:GDP-mannose 4,6-dehydratase [Patescibacteria group bacterium]
MFAISPNQEAKVKCDYRAGRRYYYAQFTTDKPTNKGRHLTRDKDEIVDIVDTAAEDNWFYDIQTESQSFATGANLIKVHNSPRRGETFVTRKITKSIANILSGKQDKLLLGNLEARRDWGYAKEYMEAIWEIMQLPYPEDIVIGTGETHTVKEFVEEAFGIAGLSWQKYVEIDERYYRPTEVDVLQADIGKAEKLIGWKPKVKFKELVKMMVDADMRAANLKPR